MDVIVGVASTVRANLDRALSTLRDAVLLVFVLLLLFLGRWRLALIPAVAVPDRLGGQPNARAVERGEPNSLTLFGLVLATGVVVSEDIAGRIERKGCADGRACECRDCHVSCSGSGVPAGSADSRTHRPALSTIALAITGAILFSTLNALSFTPMACALVLRGPGGGDCRRLCGSSARLCSPPSSSSTALAPPRGRASPCGPSRDGEWAVGDSHRVHPR